MKSKFVGFETLKRAVSIQQVLERYDLLGRLHRSGDSLSGPCPLHAGHNPTQFRVSLSRNCWICYGDCHVGGSIVDLVSRKEGVGIRDAALLIQDWFAVQPNGKPNGEHSTTPDTESPVRRPINGTNLPLRFTLSHLDPAHPYLAERGLSTPTIQTFGLGYCANGSLAGWIAIPIHNAKGQLVAYAARWPGIPPAGQPKYRLPRGFHKSQELFNLHRARQEDSSLPLVVVEGFFGCLRLWQAGHRRVISTMGSMVSEQQVELIRETAGPKGRVILLFDEDEAGRKGREHARARLAEHVTVSVVRFQRAGVQPDRLTDAELWTIVGV